MANISKIEKYHLEHEVDDLLDQGASRSVIADTISKRHPEIPELIDLSSMSIQRFLDTRERKDVKEIIDLGVDPSTYLTKEFKDAIKKNNEEVQLIISECKSILDEAKQTNSITDKVKAVDAVIRSLDQERKNWVSLQQFGERQFANVNTININKEQNVKILLLKWSEVLCPECRSKISKVFEGEEDNA